jgi:hypothetical protein
LFEAGENEEKEQEELTWGINNVLFLNLDVRYTNIVC